MAYQVKTQTYSGPFDLLLKLVTKQKVDIGALSIAEIADQYLAEVERMQEMDLDAASDFVLIAATLLDIKANSLIPQTPLFEEDDLDEQDSEFAHLDPDQARELLIERLITYKQFKNAAASLGAREDAESKTFARTAGPGEEFADAVPDYLEGITLRGLCVICADIMSKREQFLLEAEHIAPKRMPVALSVAAIDRQTIQTPHTSFYKLLEDDPSVDQIVVTFLALLELSKLGSLELSQEEIFGDIEVNRLDSAKPYEIDENTAKEWGEDPC